MRSCLALSGALLLFACPESSGGDAGSFDSGIHDAEPREAGTEDAGPDAGNLDVGLADFGPRDAFSFDGGEGASCEEARLWSDLDAPLVDTTSTSVHRARFACAGLGGGSTAPERWIEGRFDREHVILRLGTGGWDAVMSVRTATCAVTAEVACADAPTVVELPAAEGSVFLGVDGFTDGSGPFVLTSERGPPLLVPPDDSVCEAALPAELPIAREGHNIGADRAVSLEGCALTAPVYLPLDLAGSGELAVRVEPRAGQDLSVAVLSGCDALMACAAGGGAGHAETLRVQVDAPRVTLVVGSPTGARSGSFRIAAALDVECTRDADCPLGERCGADLACGPLTAFAAVAPGAEIPDNDRLVLPLVLAGPSGRPRAVRLRLAFEHEFPEDLVVSLAAPGGWPRVRLRDRLDGARDSVYGRDRPADGPGTMFDFGLTATASGTWTLEVRDRAPGDVGRVIGAVLEVE